MKKDTSGKPCSLRALALRQNSRAALKLSCKTQQLANKIYEWLRKPVLYFVLLEGWLGDLKNPLVQDPWGAHTSTRCHKA